MTNPDRSARPAFDLPALPDPQDRTLALLFLALWALVVTYLQWGHWPEDLSAVYIAGHLWQEGRGDLIYAAPDGFFGGTAPEWIPFQTGLGIYELGSFAYVYPPLWAVVTGPLTEVVSPQGFANAVTCVQVPLLAASAWLAMRILPTRGFPLWLQAGIAVALLSTMIQPFLALFFNNPSISVNFLALLAIDRLNVRQPVAAGMALGFAAAIKLTPAAFLLIFLFDRQWRALAAFAMTSGALALLSLVLAGPALHADFLASLREVSEVVLLTASNISLKVALMALGTAVSLMPPIDITEPNVTLQNVPAWLGPALMLAAAAVMAACWRALRDAAPPLRRGLSLLTLGIVIPLFGPLGWLHYYVLPLLLLPGFLSILPRRRALPLMLAIALASLSVAFANIGVLPWPSANYIWINCGLWLLVLAMLLTGPEHQPRLPQSNAG